MMPSVRTTVTLDPDTEQLVKRAMREKGLTFKQAVNDAIRAGSGPPGRGRRVDFPVHDMGEPVLDLTKALRISADLEDDELRRRLAESR